MSGKIKGKQIEDSTIDLGKLSGSGNLSINSPSQFQIVGTASTPNDVISKKDLDNAISGLSGSSITVEDYHTGNSYTDINKMIFRGNVVNTPGGTAMGVLADGSTPGSVVVWIPAPTYEDYFNQGSNGIGSVSAPNRKISDPNGDYNIGSYGVGSTQPTINITNEGILTYACSDFALYDNINGSLTLTLYGSDETTVLKTLTYNLTGTGTSTLDGLTINVTSLDPDKDRFKASVTFTIDLNNSVLIPLGGKFTVEMEHDNVGDGSYVKVNKVQTAMYDADTSDGLSNATIGGAVSMAEGSTPTLKYLSGVAYYNNGSSFTVNVTDMDNLNENTYPTGNQLTIDFSVNSGIPDASIGGGGTGYTNWSNLYNVMGVDYSESHSISNGNLVTPGINATNDLLVANETSTIAKIHDWASNVDTKASPGYKWLILSKTSTTDRNTEDFNDESRRLSVSDLLGGTETPFVSTTSLGSHELQQIQGSSPNGSSRLVYPKIDFTEWLPSVNSGTDYSSLPPQSITINVVNDKAPRTTTAETVTGYRWYVRKFTTSGPSEVQANGRFKFNTTFNEADLTAGKFRMFLETNSTGAAPTQWYDLTRVANLAGSIRSNSTGDTLDNTDQGISFDTGTHNGWNAYLLIGIAETSKDESITQIDIEGGNWD